MDLPTGLVTEIDQKKSNLEIKEISIPVPWGFVVGKWWGRRDCRPILVLHGVEDNAGSFDRLIPLLPRHVGYLAIDLPGHGLSSHIPPGMVYTILDFFHFTHLIVEYFKWDKVSLLGHSLGGIISFLYAGIFPERCDMVIAFDGLKPLVLEEHDVVAGLRINIEQSAITDQRSGNGSEPPVYDYEGLLNKIMNASYPITRETAPYLLQRGIKPSTLHPNRWYFSRDQRLKFLNLNVTSQEVAIELATAIIAPLFFIRAISTKYSTDDGNLMEAVAVLRQRNTFKFLQTDKCHHLHLTDPEYFKESVSEFILKCRPIDENQNAKL